MNNSSDQYSVEPATLTPNAAGDATYGSQVSPNPPRQDMVQADVLAGGPSHDRDDSPATFTGGTGGAGAGGMAIGQEPGNITTGAGTTVERGDRIGL